MQIQATIFQTLVVTFESFFENPYKFGHSNESCLLFNEKKNEVFVTLGAQTFVNSENIGRQSVVRPQSKFSQLKCSSIRVAMQC